MTSPWFHPEPRERPEVVWGGFWPYIIFYIVIQAISAAIVVAAWPKGKPAATADFVFAMLMPALFVTIIVGGFFHYFSFERPLTRVIEWNRLCDKRRYYWHRWAQSRLAIVTSTMLAPEDAIAERMLGLEGSAPANPDKILPLELAVPAGMTRLAYVLDLMLQPLAQTVRQLQQTGEFRVILQTGRQADLDELQRAMRKLDMPLPNLSWISGNDSAPMNRLWADDQTPSGSLLVLACQLHEGKEAPDCSELALALLLCHPDRLARGKLKPQAYLYRPISVDTDALDTALATLLRAEQTPPKRLKHFWFSRLEKRTRHAVTTAVRDTGLTLGMQDIDRCLGKASHASDWLPAVLAAQMLHHGQGSQLIATRDPLGVALNVVAPEVAGLSRPPPQAYAGITWVASVFGLAGGGWLLDFMCAKGMPEDMFMAWWAYPVIALLLIVLGLVVEGLSLGQMILDFEDRYFW
ncbi:hypothetical protein ACKI2N_008785 [Cupriavidus sp. 30B13]|uniref:hypothetical protein n=1 Tax=Cupriavidus sp. 30B13 TaxID=3384241 RepID=UPI003B915BBC